MNGGGIVDHVLKNNKQLHSSVDMADRLLAGYTFFCSRALFYYDPLRTKRVRLSYLFARSKWPPPRCVRYVCVHARRCFENTRTVRITRVARHTSVSPTPDDGRTFTDVRRFSHTFTTDRGSDAPYTRDTFRNVSGGRDVR